MLDAHHINDNPLVAGRQDIFNNKMCISQTNLQMNAVGVDCIKKIMCEPKLWITVLYKIDSKMQ